ncbi:MAG: phosphotransferase [bacterium]
MIKAIQQLYNDRILGDAMKRFGIAPDKIKKLGSFESYVYEYEKNGQEYILKITHTLRRTAAYIMGELDFVNHLSDGGAAVARAVPSETGNFVEEIEADSGRFLAYAFEKARGHHPGEEDWNDSLFAAWGQVIGRMHALTKSYRPADPSYRRQQWHKDEDLKVDRHLPADQILVRDRFDQLMDRLRVLPTDNDSYGLVHEDVHHGNFVVHNGSITVFDFVDCHYHWFADDLAVALFYAHRDSKSGGTTDFARRFLSCLLEGYGRENSFDSQWLNHFQDFLKLRELILYILLHKEGIDDLNPWSERFMQGRRESIENRTPIIDMDFTCFA